MIYSRNHQVVIYMRLLEKKEQERLSNQRGRCTSINTGWSHAGFLKTPKRRPFLTNANKSVGTARVKHIETNERPFQEEEITQRRWGRKRTPLWAVTITTATNPNLGTRTAHTTTHTTHPYAEGNNYFGMITTERTLNKLKEGH